MTQDAFGQKVAQLRARFVGQAVERVEELIVLLDKPSADFAPETRQRVLHRHYHDLAGSAAMLGFAELEAAVRAAGQSAQDADHQDRDLLDAEVATMRLATGALLSSTRNMAKAPN